MSLSNAGTSLGQGDGGRLLLRFPPYMFLSLDATSRTGNCSVTVFISGQIAPNQLSVVRVWGVAVS